MSSVKQRILRILDENKVLSTEQLSNKLKFNQQFTWRVLEEMERQGLVRERFDEENKIIYWGEMPQIVSR